MDVVIGWKGNVVEESGIDDGMDGGCIVMGVLWFVLDFGVEGGGGGCYGGFWYWWVFSIVSLWYYWWCY